MIVEEEIADLSQSTKEYILQTQRSIFLTGRAGTGKTTLVNQIRSECKRNVIVAAPTGIAAMNAGGVTLHSLFQIPLGTYIPDQALDNSGSFYNKEYLFRNHRVSAEKRRLLQNLDLLIIDEVSMLRCDLLDVIDVILRKIRRSSSPMGGVQVLFVGDLFQLPPVVLDHEKSALLNYYGAPYFHYSKVWEKLNPICVELTRIHRQTDPVFIELLERVRHNRVDEALLLDLNKRYLPQRQTEDPSTLVLTTHNHKADSINHQRLSQLPGEEWSFQADIRGDFNEKNLPTEALLRLKVGARVMFIKNHPEGLYYNGLLGTVLELEKDLVHVLPDGTEESIKIKRDTWSTVKYTFLDDEQRFQEEETGSFVQLPLKLAYAITIHKSQGLSFDKVHIDARNAFEGGQVYVALSRCRSLEGISFDSELKLQSFSAVSSISLCHPNSVEIEALKASFNNDRRQMWLNYICNRFRFDDFKGEIGPLFQKILNKEGAPKRLQVLAGTFFQKLDELEKTARQFGNSLVAVVESDNETHLSERLGKAQQYFSQYFYTHFHLELYNAFTEVPSLKGASRMTKALLEIDDQLWSLIKKIQAPILHFNTSPYLSHQERKQFEIPEKAKKKKPKSGDSLDESLRLFSEGLGVDEIAQRRLLARSTIEGHLIKLVEQHKISLDSILETDEIKTIWEAINRLETTTASQVFEGLDENYSYFKIRLVMAHIKSNA